MSRALLKTYNLVTGIIYQLVIYLMIDFRKMESLQWGILSDNI